jgi:hypothetical protein
VAEMDQGIKRLLQTHPADVLALAIPGAEYLGLLPVDVATEPQLVLDTLLRVRYAGVACAVDLEAEARPRTEMARRLFEYGTRASVVTGLPVISVVLWLQAGNAPPASPYELRVGNLLLATWHFIGIALYDLDAQALFTPGLIGLLPLVPFTRDGGDVATIERAAEIVKQRAPASDLSELESLLAVFAARAISDDAARAIIRRLFMSTEILEQSPLYRAWIQQGIEQGKAEGLRIALLGVLRGRFGTVPPELTQAINAAPADALERLLEYAGTESVEQLQARLSAL